MTEQTGSARVVLVTGDSAGIGRAVCETLHASGRRVYGASRSGPSAAGWQHLTMDVTDESSVATAVAAILHAEGRIDAVVHCAGVSFGGPFEETTIEEAKRHFDINYFGAVRVMRAVLPAMRTQSGGKLMMIGSVAGLIGLPYLGFYSSGKFALDGLVEAIRPELAAFGIEATAIHPGDFKTELSAKASYAAAARPGSPHFEAFERASAFYRKAEATAPSPHVLARRIDRLLERKRLPVRVVVGTPLEQLGVWAKSQLPSRLFEIIRAKAYGP